MNRRAQFVVVTVEVLFQTCLVSPLNAEELVDEGGITILESLLDFYVHVALHFKGPHVAPAGTIALINAHVVHTIAGVAFYESGRVDVTALASKSRLCVNLRRCIDGRFCCL
jgi:hypothetical protein